MSAHNGPPPEAKGLSRLWWGARHLPADPTDSFAHKTVLITGANTGLGFEAALKFARLRASHLILAVRSTSKGETAKAAIVSRTGYPASQIEIMSLDASSFTSVRSFAQEVSTRMDHLDIVLLNAGVAAPSYEKSTEGWEMSLQVNVLSTALLAILLLPTLRKTARTTSSLPHLEITGSVAFMDLKPELLKSDPGEPLLDRLNQEASFNMVTQYAISKLLVMYIEQGLAEKVRSPDGKLEVAVVVSCPGLCKSDLGRKFPWFIKLPTYLFQTIFARTSEAGSRTLVSGACVGSEGHGKFWNHDVFIS